MKTISIFLASSEEMDYDRMVFGNLVRRLDDVYEKRGVRLKLFEWEDYDAAFNDRRKQDEYNEKVRESDVFLALFYKKAGKFTVEEFDVASEAFKEKASPKVYAYLRDLQEGESASPELEEFKHRLFDEMGHYWCRYDSRDSLQLQFVMQLQLVENSLGGSMKVEDGEVSLDGMKVASMDRLKFAAGNEDYVKMSEELAALPAKIEKARLRLEKFPDDEDLMEDLQLKLNKYNKLKKDFSDCQKILFDTAKRIASLQGGRITGRMRRAMDAFNDGKIREANIILDEAEADARRNLEDFRQSREITEQKRQTAILSLEELILKTSTLMADESIPVEDRVNQTDKIYSQAVEMAEEVEYEEKKRAELLENYGIFLCRFARYDKALDCHMKSLEIRERVLGTDHPDTARSCHKIGVVYAGMGDYPRALEFYTKALEIRRRVLGTDHADTSATYNNIGVIYSRQGDFSKALEYYKKSLEIDEKDSGTNPADTAQTYNNVGVVYGRSGDFQKALEYHQKALEIRERFLGKDRADTAQSYNNIGLIYGRSGDFPKALKYLSKALEIHEHVYGTFHPDTARSYGSIGFLYGDFHDYSKALEYYTKSMEIKERMLGTDHPDTAGTYHKIGLVYAGSGNYPKALEYWERAKSILERAFGPEHKSVVYLKDMIADLHQRVESSG